MKSIRHDKYDEPDAIQYPCLMQQKTGVGSFFSGCVIWFIRPGIGIVVTGDENDTLGVHCGFDPWNSHCKWNMNNFEVYHGSIELIQE